MTVLFPEERYMRDELDLNPRDDATAQWRGREQDRNMLCALAVAHPERFLRVPGFDIGVRHAMLFAAATAPRRRRA